MSVWFFVLGFAVGRIARYLDNLEAEAARLRLEAPRPQELLQEPVTTPAKSSQLDPQA